jgi:transposase
MMRASNALVDVYLCVEPVDFRMQINGLAACVEGTLLLDPLSEQLFAFTNRRRNRVKVLYWERNGFVLCDRHGWRKVEQRRSSCRAQTARARPLPLAAR